MKEVALVDGDIIGYRCSASCEPTKIKEFTEPLDVAIQRADDLMNRILYETNAQSYKVYIGGSENFRKEIYPEYKANRKDVKKPIHLQLVREHLFTTWKAKIADGIEADDELGIEQSAMGTDSIICSIDKDLLQIPGYHYNFVKGIETFVSPYDGLRALYKQIITGDGSDNIPAFDGAYRGSTPQFVQRILAPIDNLSDEIEMYDYVLSVYDNHYNDPSIDVRDVVHRNAKLVYILRQEGKYWQPPRE